MTLSPRKSLALVLLLTAAGLGHALSGPGGFKTEKKPTDIPDEQVVPAAKLTSFTDPQFKALQGDVNLKTNPTGIQELQLTQKLFNEAVADPKNVPADAEFLGKNVNHVRDTVASVLKIVHNYQRQYNEADTQEKKDGVVKAMSTEVNLVVTTNLPMRAPETSLAKLNIDGRYKGLGESGNGTIEGGLKFAGRTGEGKIQDVPKGPAVDLGVIIMTVGNKAHNEFAGIGNGNAGSGNTTPSNPTPVPATPAPTNGSSGGATPNGPAQGNPTPMPTIGDVLGINDPKSPSDAMSNARERYRGGDISGGITDATRAIQLGGGAPALALRGGMQLDQKNYSQAAQDARDAMQLDPNNREAVAVYHFSKDRTDGSLAGPAAGIAAAGASGAAGAAGARAFATAGGSPSSSPAAIAAATVSASRMSGAQALKAAQGAMVLGDRGAALVYVNRALAQDPNNPALLNFRATIHARDHDFAAAAADARSGLALAPGNKALLRTLGYAQVRNKDYKGALASTNALVEADPKDAYAYALRGHAYGSLGERDAMLADLKRAAEIDPRFAKAEAQMESQLQLPGDKDFLFLFPGEEAPGGAAKTAALGTAGRGRNFGLLVGASALGGLLLALGLLHTVMAPLKDKITSAFTRVTRTGPSATAMAEVETARPASVNGLMPGLIRGQYEISRQIGAGGMGMVFAGTDRSLGRPVAIKKMREEIRLNARERERFVIEAKTVAALHHPSIVDIYSIVDDGQDVYLIFEFVAGKTVHDLVQQNGRLPIGEAARVVRAASDALTYAHAHGVVHRDMKPSNMMLDDQGRVKVMDFGIARMAKDAATRYSMTNTVVGTPPYMAPEQEQGHVRRESDVYALAICAYEMLTGKLPFIGIGAGMLMNKINMSYVGPSRATAGLPEALDEVFAKAFQADPDQRYRTPKEFADALESALPSAARAS